VEVGFLESLRKGIWALTDGMGRAFYPNSLHFLFVGLKCDTLIATRFVKFLAIQSEVSILISRRREAAWLGKGRFPTTQAFALGRGVCDEFSDAARGNLALASPASHPRSVSPVPVCPACFAP
jgi:hypothetical protein